MKSFSLLASTAALLSAFAAPAFAAPTFHLVVPLPRAVMAAPVDPITVNLAGAALPQAIALQPYSQSLRPYLSVTGDAAFDAAAATWSVVAGTLPAGLSLDSATGLLSGTPTAATSGPAAFTVKATYKGNNGQADYSVEVKLQLTVSLAGAALPKATLNQAYSQSLSSYLTVTGDPDLDKTAARWSLKAGTLPAGLTLDSTTGAVAGTPSAKTSSPASFTVLATYKGTDGQAVYTIEVGGQVLQVSQVSVGGGHACAVTTSGGLKCWGHDGRGQLGNDTALANKTTPVDVLGLTSGVASVSAGGSHTCAVTTAGGLKCWGYDYDGELGNDANLVNQPTPVNVLGLTSGVASVSAGTSHTCAVTTGGGVKCWGLDYSGQLGDDAAIQNKPTPVGVLGLSSGVRSVHVGADHTCAVTTAGGLKCWGSDSFGQLGNDASLTNQPTPVDVLGLTSGVESAGAGDGHTCAVTTGGGLKCWGRGDYGQLGPTAVVVRQPTPVDVQGLPSSVASVAAGWNHTCAVTSAGGLKCWGRDNYGQLGNDAALTNQTTPVDVQGLTSGVLSVATGSFSTCAATTSGLKCWGDDSLGQLGNDAALTNQPTPVDVAP